MAQLGADLALTQGGVMRRSEACPQSLIVRSTKAAAPSDSQFLRSDAGVNRQAFGSTTRMLRQNRRQASRHDSNK
jgi:hypothetical protein